MGLSYRFQDNGDFSRKSQIFPPRVFCASADGIPLELGVGDQSQKNQSDEATGPRKKFDGIFSRLDTIHQRDSEVK